jgi:hypothetical protein
MTITVGQEHSLKAIRGHMATFSQIMFKELGPASAAYGFRPSIATAHSDYAAFVARPDLDVCLYLLTKWSRINCQCYADFWVAPPEFPDDRVDQLGVGWHSELGRAPKPDVTFLTQVRRGIASEMGNIAEKIAIVRQAYATLQEKPTRLLVFNRCVRRLLPELATYSQTEQGQYCQYFFHGAKEVMAGKLKWSRYKLACERLAIRLLHDPQAPALVHDPTWEQDAGRLGRFIASQCYVEALVPWPPQ